MACTISWNSSSQCFRSDDTRSRICCVCVSYAGRLVICKLSASLCIWLLPSKTVSQHTPCHFISRQVFEQAPRKFVTCDSRISRQIWKLLAQWLLRTCLNKHRVITWCNSTKMSVSRNCVFRVILACGLTLGTFTLVMSSLVWGSSGSYSVCRLGLFLNATTC